MLYTINEFCKYISQNRIEELSDQIFGDTGRFLGPNERESYQQVSVMFKKAMAINPEIGDVHISVDANMLLEYKLPAASAWCDLVLLGINSNNKNQVLIIELKNWKQNSSDKPGVAEGLMWHNNEYHSHPSQQVKGYTEYCRRFHSTVQQFGAECNGIVYFTQPIDMTPYGEKPNDQLVANYPTFNTKSMDDLANYISNKIRKPDSRFAKMFVDGVYKQDRNILRQVAETIAHKRTNDYQSPFQLLDQQILGYNLVMSKLAEKIQDGAKQVIVVEGPPGSGKSAVAINVWAAAALKYTMNNEGNCVFVTTSQSQDDNWTSIFKQYGGTVAKGLILKSTSYGPGLNSSTQPKIVRYILENGDGEELLKPADNSVGYTIKEDKYAEIVDYMMKHHLAMKGYRDNQHLLSVVDEAHALINPLSPDYMGFNQGWAPFRGPQVYHIIKQSQVTVLFTDTEQSFRDYESTSTADIERFAKELKADFIKVSLDGMQFRCAGSVDYVNWVDHLLTANPIHNYSTWKKQYTLKMFDYPSELEAFLQSKLDAGDKSVRLLSSYTTPWVSGHKVGPLHRTNAPCDFEIPDKDGKVFKKYWNSTYDAFVQGVVGTTMNENPLSEVGCPYVVRGFDYSWIGLIWLKDFIYRKELGGWCIASKYVEETGIAAIKGKAKKAFKRLPKSEQKKFTYEDAPLYSQSMDDPDINRLFKALSQAYRILLTRALKGIGIYIQDKETREYVESLLQ